MDEITKILTDLTRETDEMKSIYKTEEVLLRMFRDREFCFQQNVVYLVYKCSEKINLYLSKLLTYIRLSELTLKTRSVVEYIMQQMCKSQFIDFHEEIYLNLTSLDSMLKYYRLSIIRPDNVPIEHWWWKDP